MIVTYEYDPSKPLSPKELAHIDEMVERLEQAKRDNWIDEPDKDCPPLTEKQLEKMRQIIKERKKHA